MLVGGAHCFFLSRRGVRCEPQCPLSSSGCCPWMIDKNSTHDIRSVPLAAHRLEPSLQQQSHVTKGVVLAHDVTFLRKAFLLKVGLSQRNSRRHPKHTGCLRCSMTCLSRIACFLFSSLSSFFLRRSSSSFWVSLFHAWKSSCIRQYVCVCSALRDDTRLEPRLNGRDRGKQNLGTNL